VVTCVGAGIVAPQGADIIKVGAQRNNAAGDPNVSGVVQPHAGGGEELNVTLLDPNVVIDGIVVKGGDGYNLYTESAVLPPALPSPQGYISPLVGSSNVPAISHWFICYHKTTPLPTGSLEVTKDIVLPTGIPTTPLPTTYSAVVNCDDGNPDHQNVVVNFGVGGGLMSSPPLTGIPIDTECTVIEQGGGAPVISYTPLGANSPGVTIGEDEGVVVNITNNYSSVSVQRGALQFTKVVVPGPPGVEPPTSFTVHVACDDGTTGPVTLPGTGGAGTPVLSVRTLSICALVEDVSSLPGGWTLTYSVNGGPPTATAPLIPVLGTGTTTVTVTNDATAVLPPDPGSTTTTTTSTTATTTTTTPAGSTTIAAATSTTIAGGSGVLPPTGRSQLPAGIVAGLLVGVGALLVVVRRRQI
jgi:hypothetical protein